MTQVMGTAHHLGGSSASEILSFFNKPVTIDNVQNCSQNYEYFHTSFQPFTVRVISGFRCAVLFCRQYTMHNSKLCNHNHKLVSAQLKEKLKVQKIKHTGDVYNL
jgi:hypothetical protein